MTDHPTPLTDEDLSAHLDGEGAPDLADRIAADAVARARLAELAGAARIVSDEPVSPLGASVVDDLVSRALAAHDASTSESTDPADSLVRLGAPITASPAEADEASPGTVVTPLPLAPPRPRRLPPTWLVAAAVILVVALGIGLVATGRNDTADQQATSAVDNGDRAAADSAGGGSDETSRQPSAEAPSGDAATKGSTLVPNHGGSAAAVPSTTGGTGGGAFAAIPAIDLGTFSSSDALRTALATSFPSQASATATSQVPSLAALQRCGIQVAVALDLQADPTHQGFAIVDGRAVLVYEFPASSYTDARPTTLVAAVGAESCDQVVTFQR